MAKWPIMLNDMVIAMVLVVVVVMIMMVRMARVVGSYKVISVVDDVLVRVDLAVGFGQEMGEGVDPGGGSRNVL